MFKNLSLNIKSAYQLGLLIIGLIASVLLIINVFNIVQLFDQPKAEPAVKIREQQLIQAIQFVQTSSLEN